MTNAAKWCRWFPTRGGIHGLSVVKELAKPIVFRDFAPVKTAFLAG